MVNKQRIILKAVLEGKTKRQIAKEMKISRTTVDRYLREYEKAKLKLMGGDNLKLKEDIISSPKNDTSKRVKIKLTDEITQKIRATFPKMKRRGQQEDPSSRRKK